MIMFNHKINILVLINVLHNRFHVNNVLNLKNINKNNKRNIKISKKK